MRGWIWLYAPVFIGAISHGSWSGFRVPLTHTELQQLLMPLSSLMLSMILDLHHRPNHAVFSRRRLDLFPFGVSADSETEAMCACEVGRVQTIHDRSQSFNTRMAHKTPATPANPVTVCPKAARTAMLNLLIRKDSSSPISRLLSTKFAQATIIYINAPNIPPSLNEGPVRGSPSIRYRNPQHEVRKLVKAPKMNNGARPSRGRRKPWRTNWGKVV